jgi:acyl-CoA thioester hydrolase
LRSIRTTELHATSSCELLHEDDGERGETSHETASSGEQPTGTPMLDGVHETRLQTRWTDFDALGHITHAAYPVYFDEARDAFLTATVGAFEEFPWVIAHVSIDYKREVVRPAREIVVRTRVADVGRTSVTFEQEATAAGSDLAASSRSVLVAWDPAARAARALSDDERAKLA